ncbi:hypothetical protein CBS76997_11402 [Aspergillus niger]|nr:hypothetical protein CBS13152_11358 [Aspergillus niger]KAI3032176.1 hypothetical protein CBS76997_11402 [Aspergillus niger]
MATHRIATIRFVIETPVVSNIGSKLAHYAAGGEDYETTVLYYHIKQLKMYCAFIDCMSYNKAEIRGCQKGEVDATWPVCEGPGTGVPGSLRSTVPGREVPCTSMGISHG